MKQTLENLLYEIGTQQMTDDEIMRALPLPISDHRRDWLMQRYGLCGWESMSIPAIARKNHVGIGTVKGGINRAIDLLRRHLRAGLSTVYPSDPPGPDSLISDLPLNRRILRRCLSEGWVWLRDLEGVTEEYLLTGGRIGLKFLEELRAVCKTAGVRLVPKSFGKGVSPDMPLEELISQNSMRIIEPIGAKVLSDLVPIIKGEYDPENRLWQISEKDLGDIFNSLAAAGLLQYLK